MTGQNKKNKYLREAGMCFPKKTNKKNKTKNHTQKKLEVKTKWI